MKKRLSLASQKALEALSRVFRENSLPEVTEFEEIPLRVTELLQRWLGEGETRIERKETSVLVLGEDHKKTRIVRVEELFSPRGIDPEESEFGEEVTDIE